MLMVKNKKTKMVNYIRYLFKTRPGPFRATWDCLVRSRKLILQRHYFRYSIRPTDHVILHRSLEARCVPSWLTVYLTVLKNWKILKNVNIETQTPFNTGKAA
jgi:hypothetical protein